MVELEFQFDKTVVDEDKADGIVDALPLALQITYFSMPVRLNIESTELLEIPPQYDERLRASRQENQKRGLNIHDLDPIPWLELPLLSVATAGLETVRQAKRKGSSSYSLPEYGWYIHFTSIGGDLVVKSDINGRTTRVNYDELVHAFEGFARQVREVLNREVPELQQHTIWGDWVKGNDLPSGIVL